MNKQLATPIEGAAVSDESIFGQMTAVACWRKVRNWLFPRSPQMSAPLAANSVTALVSAINVDCAALLQLQLAPVTK
jgi:hypothetical protein